MKPFISVSIVILTKNAEKCIEPLLSRIAAQKTKYSFETIIIDSGSEDSTIAIAKQFQVRIVEINPGEFGHGKTRNLGVELSRGKYIVYITQDALPLNEYWLENLVNNIAREKDVAGVYGRNIPRENCDPYEARYISRAWGEKREVKSLKDNRDLKKLVFFSNTNSCISKEVWEKIKFNENIIQTEDQDWSMRVLKAGYKIVYEPNSVVVHSHSEPILNRFKRYHDAGMAHKQIFGDNNRVHLPLIPFFALGVTLLDIKFMVENKYNCKAIAKWAFTGMLFHFIEASGFWAGLHSRYFPRKMRAKLSLVLLRVLAKL